MTLRYLTSALLIALLAGCAPPEPPAPEAVHAFKSPLDELHPVSSCTITRGPCTLRPTRSPDYAVPSEAVAREAAMEVIAALKARDMAAVAKWAHPYRGVRFSPSVFVNPETDQVWSAAALPAWPWWAA